MIMTTILVIVIVVLVIIIICTVFSTNIYNWQLKITIITYYIKIVLQK